MNFFDFLKNLGAGKIIMLLLLATIIVVAMVLGGYALTMPGLSLSRQNVEEKIGRKMAKIVAQNNQSIDMKNRLSIALSDLYREVLKKYTIEHNIRLTDQQIETQSRYYKLLVQKMNDDCENLTLERYILNNDLYRYSNESDWKNFKQNVINQYMLLGKQVIAAYYDNSLVTIPANEWTLLAGREILQIVTENANILLDALKTESTIYYNQNKD